MKNTQEEKCICDDLKNIPHTHNDGRIVKPMNPIPPQNPNSSWEEEFILKSIYNDFQTWKEGEPTCWHYDHDKVLNFIKEVRVSALKARDAEILGMLIKKFNDLENADPDQSTENWRNYKFIRNTIVDTLSARIKDN